METRLRAFLTCGSGQRAAAAAGSPASSTPDPATKVRDLLKSSSAAGSGTDRRSPVAAISRDLVGIPPKNRFLAFGDWIGLVPRS